MVFCGGGSGAGGVCSRVAIVQKCSVLLGSPFPGPLARESRLLYFSSIIIELKYCYKKILSKWVLICTVYIQLFVLGRHRHIEFKYLQNTYSLADFLSTMYVCLIKYVLYMRNLPIFQWYLSWIYLSEHSYTHLQYSKWPAQALEHSDVKDAWKIICWIVLIWLIYFPGLLPFSYWFYLKGNFSMLYWTILVWNFKIFQELWDGFREERSQDSQFWTDCCYIIKIYYSHIDYIPMTWGIFLTELWFLMFWKLLSFFIALKIPPLASFFY